MNKTLLLAGVAACLFAANANAVELNQYVSGKLTYSDASHDVKWDNEDGEAGKQKFSDNVLGGSFAYGVKTGAVRTELELNIKQDAEKKVSDEFGTTKVKMENNSVMLNAYYGIGMARLKGSIKGDDANASKSKTTFAWQVGAGVSYAMTDNLALDAGYRYTDADEVNVKNDGSNNKFEAKSHEFLLGARYSF